MAQEYDLSSGVCVTVRGNLKESLTSNIPSMWKKAVIEVGAPIEGDATTLKKLDRNVEIWFDPTRWQWAGIHPADEKLGENLHVAYSLGVFNYVLAPC